MACGDGQATELRFKCRFMANNTGMMTDIAVAGLGIVYGPTFTFGQHLAAGELAPVLPSYTSPLLPLHAITPTAKHVNVKTRLFIDRLKAAFGDPPPWHSWLNAR